MNLLDTVTKGWGGGLLIGLGAAVAAPIILPAAGAAVRPIAKGLVWGCLAAVDKLRELAAETREQVNDLVAEVRAEVDGNSTTSGARRGRPLGV